MIKQLIFFKIAALILALAFLCGACTQTSIQSEQTRSNNSSVQLASPPASADPITPTSPTPQNANKAATSVNTNTALSEVADKGKVQRVQFARGRTSAIFKDVVIQNKDNEYLLEAKAGQTMTISMKVDENRKSPDSDYDVALQIFKAGNSKPFAELEKKSWQGRLPETGEYIIRVISITQGNGYTLKITIR